MKEYLVIILILIIPYVSSQEIIFFKEDYSPGETVQLKINLSITPIKDLEISQIKLENTPIQPIILKIDSNHYVVYFNLPTNLNPDKYTLFVSDITYRENNILKTTNFNQNLIIKTKSYNLIQILPGIVTYFKGDPTFKAVRITNLENSPISLELTPSTMVVPSISLLQIPGISSKTFYLRVIPELITSTGIFLYRLDNNYQIPIYLEKKEEIVDTCTEFWQCSIWSECMNDQQIRKCIDLNNCNLQENKPEEQQHCQTVCIPGWNCSEWSSCNNNFQTRICTDLNKCSLLENKPEEQQHCHAPCVENWQCDRWGECISNIQTRGCIDINKCNTIKNKPLESQSCQSTCNPNWQCSIWSECISNKQERNCIDLNNCGKECTPNKCNLSQNCTLHEPIINNTKVLEPIILKKDIIFFSDINNPEITVNSLVNTELPENKELNGPLFIKNIGEVTLKDLQITLTGNLKEVVKINITRIKTLEPNQIIKQFIWINKDKNLELDEYQGSLLIESEDFSVEFPIYLTVSRDIALEQKQEENLFIEDKPEKIETIQRLPTSEQNDEPIKIKVPYKPIIIFIVLIFLVLLYVFAKKSSKKKTQFSEYLSKIEKN